MSLLALVVAAAVLGAGCLEARKPRVRQSAFVGTSKRYCALELDERPGRVAAGSEFRVRFHVRPLAGHLLPPEPLPMIRVTAYELPALERTQQWVLPDAAGAYEVTVTAPRAGEYHLYFESGSRGWEIGRVPLLRVQAS